MFSEFNEGSSQELEEDSCDEHRAADCGGVENIRMWTDKLNSPQCNQCVAITLEIVLCSPLLGTCLLLEPVQ